MKQSSETQSSKKPTDVRSGVALAATAFVVSILLYFQPQYFGALTTVVAIALIVLGFMGLGVELNKMTSEESNLLLNQNKGAGIFDNLGIGIGLLVLWGALYHYFPTIWVNVLISIILFFGMYGTILGIVNLLFLILIGSNKVTSSEVESNKPGQSAIKIVAVISSIVGFIASLIQIFQFFKVIP